MRILTRVLIIVLLWQTTAIQNRLGQPSMAEAGLMPSGAIMFVDTGACPAGYTEEGSSGNYIILTTNAGGNAGTTGGSNSYTPAGTVAAPVFTGSQVTTSAVSAGTPAGTNGTASVATVTGSKAGTSSGAFSTIGGASPGSSFTVPAETFTGSALATHTHTDTAAGTNSAPAFTGNTATIQPTFLRLIGCKKT